MASAPLDRIELRGLRAVGIIGVLPEERVRAQPFEVDVDVVVDLSVAGTSDALDDTLDYAAIAAMIELEVSTGGYSLIERLAERIAERVMVDERVWSVTVAVRKLRPPVPHDMASAGVSVTRTGPAGN